MPELPDVEGFRRTAARATGCRVRSVQVRDAQVLHGITPERFDESLRGRRIAEPRRLGKWLVVPTDGERSSGSDGEFPRVLLHFGMTGMLRFSDADEQHHPHDRVVFDLSEGDLSEGHLAEGQLRYRDQRKLTGLHVPLEPAEQDEVLGEQGPDALEVSNAEFKARLGRTGRQLKPALMDQSVVAGLGNLCVDELLWRARLHPRCSTAELTSGELGRLHRRMLSMLRQASRVGEVPARGSWLTGHRDEAQARCPRCGTRLSQGRAGGRSTVWCSNCQPGRP